MLTLTDYIVLDRLYSGGTGPEAQTGDEVRLYLDTEAIPAFPEYIIGVVQNPIVRVNCDTSTSYSIEYNEADLAGAVEFLRPQDVINSEVTSALDELASAIEIETAARIADVNAEEAARIAADALKQPLDADLTAYANAADAAARRALIGAVGTALEITTALQDLTLDPLQPTKISKDRMPDTVDLDYLVLGEAAGEALPVGGLSRIGKRLATHDGVTLGGKVIKDRLRFVGSKKILPFGTTVSGVASTVKRAGSYYWDEVGRITLPGEEIVNNRLIHTQAWTRIISDEAMALAEKTMLLVPAGMWDSADYFGASPVYNALSASATPSIANWRPVKSNSLDSECLMSRVNLVGVNEFGFNMAVSTQYASRGFDKTSYDAAVTAIAAAADLTALKTALASLSAANFSIADTGSYSPFAHTVGADLELVIVSFTTTTETRTVYADITLSLI